VISSYRSLILSTNVEALEDLLIVMLVYEQLRSRRDPPAEGRHARGSGSCATPHHQTCFASAIAELVRKQIHEATCQAGKHFNSEARAKLRPVR
jgi:hypothetical protein